MQAVDDTGDLFGILADECKLLDIEDVSAEGRYERYLYSPTSSIGTPSAAGGATKAWPPRPPGWG